MPPQDTVFTQATQGDLVVSIPAGDTYVSPPLETDRFTQPDGSLLLDWSASASVKVWAVPAHERARRPSPIGPA